MTNSFFSGIVMTSLNANVFFFLYAFSKTNSVYPKPLEKCQSERFYFEDGDEVEQINFSKFSFSPLDFSSTYGSMTSLNIEFCHEDYPPFVMMTSQCISPIPRCEITVPKPKNRKFKHLRCYKCNRPGHFAYICKKSNLAFI